MKDIEAIIVLILLFMSVPDLCRKIGRPALATSVFVIVGILLGACVDDGVRTMLKGVGQVGFLLVLFEVGLEIELPKGREMVRPLRNAAMLAIVQYPLIFGLATLAGLSLVEALIAAAALTGCSLSMTYSAWKAYPMPSDQVRTLTLHMMVMLELIAIVLLSVETILLEKGISWLVPIKLLGIALTVFLVARYSAHLNDLFQLVLTQTTHWRVHFLVVLVLVICALGERLGLPAAKTAFVLGLFMSRIHHNGMALEEVMAPISRRFLIPIFFVALGLQIEWRILITSAALLALATACFLLGIRQLLHIWCMKSFRDKMGFLLFCPNLTVVGLAANSLLQHGKNATQSAAWLLLSGLFVSAISIFMLPKAQSETGATSLEQPGSTLGESDTEMQPTASSLHDGEGESMRGRT